MRGVFLHVLADTLGSVGVIISTILIQMYGWYLSDPIVAVFISVLIFLSVIPLVESTASVLLQRVPKEFETTLEYILGEISCIDGVVGVREPHVWKLAGNELIGSLNVYVTPQTEEQLLLPVIQSLFKQWGVANITVQIEKESFLRAVPTETIRGTSLTYPRSMFQPKMGDCCGEHEHGLYNSTIF